MSSSTSQFDDTDFSKSPLIRQGHIYYSAAYETLKRISDSVWAGNVINNAGMDTYNTRENP